MQRGNGLKILSEWGFGFNSQKHTCDELIERYNRQDQDWRKQMMKK